MSEKINFHRRGILACFAATAAATVAAWPNMAQAAVTTAAPGTNATLAPIRQIRAGELDVGYFEAGPADGKPVILLHGWPYDIHSYAEVAPLLAAAGYRVIVPHLRGHGSTRFLSDSALRNGQQAVVALDIIALMDALKIEKAILAGYDWGARTANIIAALWPERCKAMVSVNGYLINNRERNKLPLSPKAEHGWWYQFYFATERGQAGYEANRRDFAHLIWKANSPQWHFDEASFERSAASFDNPDHVRIVIHNYRWRLSLAEGDARYDALERRLAAGPVIAAPTITLDGDADGVAPATDGTAYAAKFSGKRSHRIIKGAGHNLPQEAPLAFAQAVMDVDAY
jgi:pimeloyl-ACP methyl ester carboxylesterase